MYAAVVDRVPTEDTKEKKKEEELIHPSIHPQLATPKSQLKPHRISQPRNMYSKQQPDDASLNLSGMGREPSRWKATKTSL
jgi:hypothetical protein